ncbi:MAG: ATP-dependent DNA helicase [Treponema sp.]|nr:ATP-dependent DNA helicase [Treponema sp.]
MDADLLCTALEEDIAGKLQGYERRDAQLDLIRLIVRSFNEDAVVAAEAGTGVGKSFAYLLPAVEFALARNKKADERIVISTATITLQQQLYEKDIPLVLSALGKNVKYVLVKGRGNYLCRRRLADALMEPPLDKSEYKELCSIGEWSEQTKTGSRSDLFFLPSPSLWLRLCSESDTCQGIHCAHLDHCFFMALRKEAADAGILVVNHHLLFADLAARHEGAGYESAVVLPPFTRVIIDEAHTIEDSATSFFSKSWSRLGINRSLSRLYRNTAPGGRKSVQRVKGSAAARRKRRTAETGLLLRLSGGFAALPGGIPKVISELRDAAGAADLAALALCGDEGFFRLKRETDADPLGILRQPLEKMQRSIGALVDQVSAMIKNADEEDPAIREINAILRRFTSVAEICGSFLKFDPGINKTAGNSEVFWFERNGGYRDDPWVTFTITPVSIASLLKEALFEANKTVVCVSATLSTGGPVYSAGISDFTDESSHGHSVEYNAEKAAASFRFWAERTGAALARREFLCGVFPSPFPYDKRTLLAVPKDAPLPDSSDYRIFTNHAITELVRLTGGSALVLFTSYQALRSAFEEAAPVLESEGIKCLKQGDDDRTRLLRQFLEDKTSVLFGTDSFWEGVDAPGETLRLLILCRLPFKTLKDPVFEARREYLENLGRNSFTELSLPDAVMKFKQGFGRLIRNSSDYGAVVVLDGRLLNKYYGSAFFESLPETKTSFKEFDKVLLDLERFFY